MVLLRFSTLREFRPHRESQGESMRDLKATGYTCGLGAMIVGLGVYSYQVRELLTSLVLFTIAFFFVGLVALGVFLIWSLSEKVTIWTQSASRNVIALSRRLITAYARP
jgi:nicotinamide riboside transporter PnuC